MVRKKRPKQIRVLIDTSVVIAGIGSIKKPPIEPYNASQKVLRLCFENTFSWVVSNDILEEYKAVMKALKIRPHVAGRLVNHIKEHGEMVIPSQKHHMSPDPEDDMFYDCAIAGDADIIVALNLKDFPQVGNRPKILTPQAFAMLYWRS